MAPIIDAATELTGSLFPSRPPQKFVVTSQPFASITESVLREFLEDSVSGDYLGTSYLSQKQQSLSAVVFATPTRVLHITGLNKDHRTQSQLLERFVCCNDKLRLFGADMDILAYGLYTDARVIMANGIDILSLELPDPDADRIKSHSFVLGNAFGLKMAAIRDVFLTQSTNPVAKALVRAREYAIATQQDRLDAFLLSAPRISTKVPDMKILRIMAKIHRDSAMLDAKKPTKQKNDVAKEATITKDGLTILSSRYKTRIRNTPTQKHMICAENGSTMAARVKNVKGKAATLKTQGAPPTRIDSVVTFGKDPPTLAENRKKTLLLQFLQGRVSFEGNAVFSAIWTGRFRAPPPHPGIVLPVSVTVPLNASQIAAVCAVLAEPPSASVSVQLIRGPPGTGKTSTISAIVQALRATQRPIWIVANQNVAVKNIAEKLLHFGFLDFKLLVSREFHFDWHEHLYQDLQPHFIRSEKFAKLNPPEVERLLSGCGVILCTISMLSNFRMLEAGFTQVVPVENLLVDEASQIDAGDYLNIAHSFSRDLRRLAFVGDEKQLAPHGQDDIPDLKSIFEVGSHSSRALMLNECHRLPTPICDFISRHMYDGKLQSVTKAVKTRNSCKFVDIKDGTEVRLTHSWTNQLEADTCISVVNQLHKRGITDFKIITPYDAQRAVLLDKLKATCVPWEDRVFCVDSFQGNEADYIVISLVRTKKPGFMTNARRTNVMLTRCKKGMYICSQRAFLKSPAAQDTLVGKMAQEWGADGWISSTDVLNGRI